MPLTPPTPAQHLCLCIERGRAAMDGRGAARAQGLCAAALGGSTIDQAAAAAARRLGRWLRTAGATTQPRTPSTP